RLGQDEQTPFVPHHAADLMPLKAGRFVLALRIDEAVGCGRHDFAAKFGDIQYQAIQELHGPGGIAHNRQAALPRRIRHALDRAKRKKASNMVSDVLPFPLSFGNKQVAGLHMDHRPAPELEYAYETKMTFWSSQRRPRLSRSFHIEGLGSVNVQVV